MAACGSVPMEPVCGTFGTAGWTASGSRTGCWTIASMRSAATRMGCWSPLIRGVAMCSMDEGVQFTITEVEDCRTTW